LGGVGGVFLTVAVMVGIWPQLAVAQKETVAVERIENNSEDPLNNGNRNRHGSSRMKYSRSLRDMLTTAIVRTGKLNVIDKGRATDVYAEQHMAIKKVARGGYYGDALQRRGVDYLVNASITEFSISDGGPQPEGVYADNEATLALDVRVVKVRTGEIGFAQTVRAKAGGDIQIRLHAAVAGGGAGGANGQVKASSRRNKDKSIVGEVMRTVADEAAKLIVTAIYPVQIIRVRGDQIVTLNYGDTVVSEGERYTVFRLGKKLTDPDTGESLGQDEELVGSIKVTHAGKQTSRALVVGMLVEDELMEVGMLAKRDESRPWERTDVQLVAPRGKELFN